MTSLDNRKCIIFRRQCKGKTCIGKHEIWILFIVQFYLFLGSNSSLLAQTISATESTKACTHPFGFSFPNSQRILFETTTNQLMMRVSRQFKTLNSFRHFSSNIFHIKIRLKTTFYSIKLSPEFVETIVKIIQQIPDRSKGRNCKRIPKTGWLKEAKAHRIIGLEQFVAQNPLLNICPNAVS